MRIPPVDHPGQGTPGLAARMRMLEASVVRVWLTGIIGCLLLWSNFQVTSNLPPKGTWGWRVLALLSRVSYDDPALIQRVHVTQIAVLLSAGCVVLLGG